MKYTITNSLSYPRSGSFLTFSPGHVRPEKSWQKNGRSQTRTQELWASNIRTTHFHSHNPDQGLLCTGNSHRRGHQGTNDFTSATCALFPLHKSSDSSSGAPCFLHIQLPVMFPARQCQRCQYKGLSELKCVLALTSKLRNSTH